MTHGSSDVLGALASQHLPSDVAGKWSALLRPSARLSPAAGSARPVGRLGGRPRLPAGVEWPAWEGHGPLSLIASIDCGALPVQALDIDLPESGTLLFFYFDGQLDDGDALVLAEDRDSWAGARVLHVPADDTGPERETPEDLKPYPVVPLTARVEMTVAEPWHPRMRDTFAPGAPLGQRYDHPVCAQEFLDALWELDDTVGHQVGGHAHSIQNPVEIEIAEAALGGEVPRDDPRLSDEAGDFVLLAQFDSDAAADMMWGDCGTLYWLIRPRDLVERRFDRAMFTWQCS
ncbi:YwqG family protein [Streptomyces massasporeus]